MSSSRHFKLVVNFKCKDRLRSVDNLNILFFFRIYISIDPRHSFRQNIVVVVAKISMGNCCFQVMKCVASQYSIQEKHRTCFQCSIKIKSQFSPNPIFQGQS